MDEQYLYAAVRYIELNPVRAGIVDNPLEYEWSSARAHARGEQDILLTQTEVLDTSKWEEFLQGGISEEDYEAIRKHENTGRPLGSESFIRKLEKITGRILRRKKPGPEKGTKKKKSKKKSKSAKKDK